MRVFHDSRSSSYRSPYGAITPGTPVSLMLDIYDAPDASVVLRAWIEGEGERLYKMAAEKAGADLTRFQVTVTPERPCIFWYYFLITDGRGNVQRYGTKDGCFGGSGQLRDWEPPSFQLTVLEAPEAGNADGEPAGGRPVRAYPFADGIVAFLRGEASARALAEEIEAYRENCAPGAFDGPFDFLGGRSCEQLIAQLGGVDIEGGVQLDDSQRGRAKGRLWCASLIQLLSPSEAYLYADVAETGAGTENPEGRAVAGSAFPGGCDDADCETIARNAYDLRRSLPLFARALPRAGSPGDELDASIAPSAALAAREAPPAERFSCFAIGDDVLGFWRMGDDGSAACVLVNGSLRDAHDVLVPMAGEAVSEIISGYGVPLVNASDLAEHERAGAAPCASVASGSAERFARVHLYQLGTAALHFHPATRLESSLEGGLGILAHLTSIPGGTLGEPALEFIDQIADTGARYWQVLPINPTDDHGSPYAGISAFAGNALLIGDEGACNDAADDPAAYRAFCERQAAWLEPYAAFMAIRRKLGAGIVWQDWPEPYRRYDPKLTASDPELAAFADECRHEQFRFEQQWKALHARARERGLRIIGDMPLYVSADSADAWANPEIFQLGDDGLPTVVAGCPPDRFAEDGQVWGNPVYDWDALEADGYSWWMRRLRRAFELYDVVRLDHFIGFSRYFAIPAGEKALAGAYHPGPGLAFFKAAHKVFGPLPIIAEDLGSITPAVRALGAACGFPGMDIVQFVDGNDPLAGYDPRPEKIAYTGTHDNQTLAGYAAARYPDLDASDVAEKLVDAVAGCGAPVRILPLQDLIGLGDEARMNTPGTTEGNWEWQASPAEVAAAAERLRALAQRSFAPPSQA